MALTVRGAAPSRHDDRISGVVGLRGRRQADGLDVGCRNCVQLISIELSNRIRNLLLSATGDGRRIRAMSPAKVLGFQVGWMIFWVARTSTRLGSEVRRTLWAPKKISK